MKKYVNLFVFVFMLGACLSQGRAQTKSAVSYKNPVVDIAMPDPTVIKAADGYFYVYATEDVYKRQTQIISLKSGHRMKQERFVIKKQVKRKCFTLI